MVTSVTENLGTNVTRKAWSPFEVAKATGLSLAFVRKEIKKGALFAVRAGRRWLVSDGELQRYLAEGSRKAGAGINSNLVEVTQ